MKTKNAEHAFFSRLRCTWSEKRKEAYNSLSLASLSEKKKELKKNRNSGAREGTEIMEGLTPCDVFLVVIGKGYGLKVARHRLSLKYFPIRVSGSD